MLTDLFSWAVTSVIGAVFVGVGFAVMSMNPPAFLMAKLSFTLAALIFFARVGWWLASMRDTAERVTLTAILFVIGGLCFVGLLWWVDSRKPQPVFGDSPALTGRRRARVAKEFASLCDYLNAVGFDIPPTIAPLQVSKSGHIGHVGNPGSPYGDSILLGIELIDDPAAIRQAYVNYIFYRLLDVGKYDLSEHINRWDAASVLATYFANSYSGRLIKSGDWDSALWDMRKSFGKELMDNAVLRIVKLFDKPGGDEKGEFNAFFRERLLNGFIPLAQGGGKLAQVDAILAAHHLFTPLAGRSDPKPDP